MSRRLNPELFETQGGGALNQSSSSSVPPLSQFKTDKEIQGLKKLVSRLETEVEVLQSRMGQSLSKNESRTDRLSQAITQVEQQDRQSNLELVRKIRSLEGRLQEQAVMEGQVQNLVDRFNTNLQHFENRLSTLQKIIAEKEMTLLQYRSALDKLFAEIEKLKQNRL